MRPAYVYEAIRTGRGKASPRGALHGVKPIELVASLMRHLAEHGLDSETVDDVVLGCVTQSGEQGANLAKIAALYAGWSDRVPGATINRFCTSGLDAIAVGAMKIQTGNGSCVVAGGVESMSRVPMFSDHGPWFADAEVAEATRFVHMVVAADLLATRADISRETLDEYAAESHRRAQEARTRGLLARSTVSIHGFADDELIRPGSTVDALGRLDVLGASIDRPEWLTEHIEHRHTVGSAPGMADAASLVVLSAAPSWEERRPRARLVSSATVSVDAVEMLSGNVQACGRALERAGVLPAQVDVWEVNESFAVVPVHFARSLEIDASRLNPNGGAIAMGHPLGATGGVLTATLLDELDARGGRYGVVSICGGAGVATALVFERLDDTV